SSWAATLTRIRRAAGRDLDFCKRLNQDLETLTKPRMIKQKPISVNRLRRYCWVKLEFLSHDLKPPGEKTQEQAPRPSGRGRSIGPRWAGQRRPGALQRMGPGGSGAIMGGCPSVSETNRPKPWARRHFRRHIRFRPLHGKRMGGRTVWHC